MFLVRSVNPVSSTEMILVSLVCFGMSADEVQSGARDDVCMSSVLGTGGCVFNSYSA